MCRETLIYGAEYFFNPCTYNNQTNFLINHFERRIPKMYTITYLTIFYFELKAN